jgi:hypothetical protein
MTRPVLFVGLLTLGFGACAALVAVTGSPRDDESAPRAAPLLHFVGPDGGTSPFRAHLFGLADDGGDGYAVSWCGNDGQAPPPPPAYVPGYGPPTSTPVTVTNTYPVNVCVQKIVAGSFWYFSVPVPAACASYATLTCACLGTNSFAPCTVGATAQCTTNGQGYPQYLCVGQ